MSAGKEYRRWLSAEPFFGIVVAALLLNLRKEKYLEIFAIVWQLTLNLKNK